MFLEILFSLRSKPEFFAQPTSLHTTTSWATCGSHGRWVPGWSPPGRCAMWLCWLFHSPALHALSVPRGVVTPYHPGALLPFVFPRAVEEGSIQATYIEPAETVPSPYGWSSATGTGRPRAAEHTDISPAAKAKGAGVRGGTSPRVQRWLLTSRAQPWDTGPAP